jgi:hypothetical protein
MEKADAKEPIDPMESADPTEPTDRTEPFDAIESTEPSDHNDQRDSDDVLRFMTDLLIMVADRRNQGDPGRLLEEWTGVRPPARPHLRLPTTASRPPPPTP